MKSPAAHRCSDGKALQSVLVLICNGGRVRWDPAGDRVPAHRKI